MNLQRGITRLSLSAVLMLLAIACWDNGAKLGIPSIISTGGGGGKGGCDSFTSSAGWFQQFIDQGSGVVHVNTWSLQ